MREKQEYPSRIFTDETQMLKEKVNALIAFSVAAAKKFHAYRCNTASFPLGAEPYT
ncbi:hypothetical protein KYI92_02150 [Pantoea allii]|uniref:Uncharacterized protein n=1 Tax=Pantoea allii TaxID=574096 RepID=A0ABS6V9P2_9GAMM|nr:hypothetical protein [Pantoea allii]MBW1212346.1 hypothetical protein [Pantoea allii]MBW1256016.1 hypothetical protein [Pantoea allii]MBW1265093.1 hypothetical protein [Pantoea allii]MBW1287210.1 hypothetical protein [Pantoea allii]